MLSIGEANKKVKRGNKSKTVLCAFTRYFVVLPLFTSVHKRFFKELKMFKTNKPPRDIGCCQKNNLKHRQHRAYPTKWLRKQKPACLPA